MRFLITFGRFWYDFIVGDDWRLGAGTLITILLTVAATARGINVWWLLVLLVSVLLATSVNLATRPKRSDRPASPPPV